MAKKTPPLNIEKIIIINARFTSESIEASDETIRKYPKISRFACDFDCDFKVNPTKKHVLFALGVKINAADENKNFIPVKAAFNLEFVYWIEDLENYIIHKSDTNIILDHTLVQVLASITYSTSRGLILSKTNDSFLKGLMLPVVDPNNLIAHKKHNS